MSHIQYVLYSLGQITTRIHNIRAYLLTSLYNAPDTMTFYYSRKVYEDLGYQPVSNFGNNDKSDPFRISEQVIYKWKVSFMKLLAPRTDTAIPIM